MLSRLLWTIPFLGAAAFAQSAEDALVRDLLRELIETDTTQRTGSTGKAADRMAARLLAAGFAPADVQVLGPRPERANLVARIRGTGRREPLLLIAHLDVVEANRADWTTDPFRFVDKDGYYYGRGAIDIKSGAALLVANFIRWQKEGYKPNRDLILALTADEEGGTENGIDWLLKNRRELIDAGYCLNVDGGGLERKGGRNLLNEIQYAEKAYLSFELEARDKGGHSSVPGPRNAIYELSEALVRLGKLQFPVMLDEGRRAYFEAAAARSGDPQISAAISKLLSSTPPDPAAVALLAASPAWNAMLRTTCVATMLQAGHAENALPQSARATVNCRIMPGHSPDEVERTLRRTIDDDRITLTPDRSLGDASSPPSPLKPEVLKAARAVTQALWPGVGVVPVMSAGATDAKFLRRAGIPTYGISGIADDVDDIRAHGKDERIAATALFEARDFMYRLVRALSGAR